MTATGHPVPGTEVAAEPAWPAEAMSGSVGRRFEEVVDADPAAIAFCSPAGATISYDELNADSNRLARLIRDRDAEQPDGVVGLLARHPAPAITGMLAALKAGRVYAPLDPSDPPSRLEHIVAASGMRALVSAPEHTELARRIAPSAGSVAVIGADDGTFACDNLEDAPAPTDPAYLLFTSGSTGRPKGVVHDHRNLLRKGRIARTLFGMGRGDRVSLLFGPATGAATTGIFGPLLNGGTVCPFELRMQGLHRVGAWVVDRRITILHTVPTVFRRILDVAPVADRFPSVRLVILSGEALYRRDVEAAWRRFGPDTVLAHRLSSTETSVVTCGFLQPGSPLDGDIVPVGIPVDGRIVRLVDDSGSEVALGEIGQIEVESDHLAVGYWRDAELTDAKFGTRGNGRRTFRMGDLGRFREDGQLEYMGRVDDRLKINGVTIEPREVERALQQAGRFKEVAVVGSPAGDGEQRLVAYVVPDDGHGVPPDLRASLGARLPAPMIPTAFVEIDSLPLTALGKVDKRSLPTPESVASRAAEPRDELEKHILAIWSEVLGVDQLGVTDDFFEVGGSSIQALQTFALIGKRLAVDVPSTTLLQAPTVAALASVIRQESWVSPQECLVPIAVQGAATPFFCVHGGGGGVFFARELATELAGNRPVFALQARGFEGRPSGYQPVEELAAGYLREVRRVQPHGPYLLGGLSFGGKVAFEMAQQLVATGEDVAMVALLDTQANPTIYDRDPTRHLRRIQQMRGPERLGYLAQGASRRASKAARRALIRFHLATNRPLTDTFGLRNLYFYPMHSRANRAYEPRVYAGSVGVIAAAGTSQRHHDTWGRVCEGSFSVVEVATTHEHLTKPPHVTMVAGYLQQLLDGADPRVATASPSS